MLDRNPVLELARLMEEITVSGDRIGSTHHDYLAVCDQVFGSYSREVDS